MQWTPVRRISEKEHYASFVRLFGEANARISMRLVAFCLMPNHFHLVLWPENDGSLSPWMQWLLTIHVRRHHRSHDSNGHLWQGRFHAFPSRKTTTYRPSSASVLSRAGLTKTAKEVVVEWEIPHLENE